MKIGEITEHTNSLSYKGQRFNKNKFILCVRDYRYEHNVIPIICYENQNLIDLDEYEFKNNIYASRPPFHNPNNIQDQPLNRFYYNQLLQIDNGTIIENQSAENPNLPKIKTFNVNINSLEKNQVIEIFEGNLIEESSTFKPSSDDAFELIKNVYIETEECFLIYSKSKLIGPFTAIKVNDNSFKISKSNYLKFGEYIFDDSSYLEFEIDDFQRRIYISSNNLKLEFKSEFDFISDEELMKEFEKELTNNSLFYNEESITNFKQILSKALEIPSLEKIIKNNNRLSKLLEKSDKMLNRNIELINLLPEFKKLKKDKDLLEEDLSVLRNQKNESEDNLEFLNQQIAELSEQKKSLQEENESLIEESRKKIQQEIIQLESRKLNLEAEITQQKLDLEKNLEEIKKDVSYYERSKSELSMVIDKLREDFKNEQKNSQNALENLVKSKIHFDFISGRDLSDSINNSNTDNLSNTIIKDRFNTNQYRDFRNELIIKLKQNNRTFETHFIDNVLISIFQNILTIFAGVPGTGKTTLARLLANSLAPKEYIREVSINRGWTSQKDFIGFVNPLTKKFHSSPTNIYSLLKQIEIRDENSDNYLQNPLSFVILDEANLSPLEHYWSSFYNLTDSIGNLTINLGNNENITFPNNLRFIGTINYDHTTEELSPRVLDRINIIQLNKNLDINFNGLSKIDLENIYISLQRSKEFFELNDNQILNPKIDDKIEETYKQIKEEFKALKIFVSPRVEIAIKRYIAVASKYMSDINKPLDYCIAQRLLPLINLQGVEYKQKLESLKDFLSEHKCEISAKILGEIITLGSEKGVNEDSFNYFLTISNV